ncbi:hypothetical protein CPAV1605_434 [seawater metagenome]|uniref:Uncharacterized protein n=1 Tax=seawater metagenome TaxID=1561972 RepID=A0A5E8CJB2_9ZZZZ
MIVEKIKFSYNFDTYNITFKCYKYPDLVTKKKTNKIYFYIRRVKLVSLIKVNLYQIIDFENKIRNYKSSKDFLSPVENIKLLEEFVNSFINTKNKNKDKNSFYDIISVLYQFKYVMQLKEPWLKSIKKNLTRLVEINFENSKEAYFLFFNIQQFDKINTLSDNNYDFDDSNNYDTNKYISSDEDLLLQFID